MNFWQKYKKTTSSLLTLVIVFNIAGSVLFAPKPAEAAIGKAVEYGVYGSALVCGLGALGGIWTGGLSLAAASGACVAAFGTTLGAVTAIGAGTAGLLIGTGEDKVEEIKGNIEKQTGIKLGEPGNDGNGTLDNFILGIGSIMLTWSVVIFDILGLLFNNMLFYTLNTSAMPLGTIQLGWSIVLGIANILFIFIILYISLNTVLGLSGANTYKLLGKLILVALLINFSLTFTNVLIDASNIIAREFWYKTAPPLPGEYPDLAGTIYYAYNFENLITTKNNLDAQERSVGSAGDKTEDQAAGSSNNAVSISSRNIGLAYMGVSMFVFIACFVLGMAVAIFSVRFIKLMILMIFSPLAFLGYIIPPTEGLSKQWWGTLTSEAFLAPAFMFFVYIAISINVGIVNLGLQYDRVAKYFLNGPGGADPEIVYMVVFSFVITSILLLGASVAAKMMSNDSYQMGGKLAGLAFGTGVGAVAAGGRQIGGRAGQWAYERLADKDFTGSATLRSFADNARKGSWDIRNAPALGSATELAGAQAGMKTSEGLVFKDAKASVGGRLKEQTDARAKEVAAEKERKDTARRLETDRIKSELSDESKIRGTIAGYDNLSADKQKEAISKAIQERMKKLRPEEQLELIGDNVGDPGKKHLIENLSDRRAIKTLEDKLNDEDKVKLQTLITGNKKNNKGGAGYYKEQMLNTKIEETKTKIDGIKTRLESTDETIKATARAEMKQLVTDMEDDVASGLDSETVSFGEFAQHLDASQLSSMLKAGKFKTSAIRQNVGRAIKNNRANNASGYDFLQSAIGRVLLPPEEPPQPPPEPPPEPPPQPPPTT